MGMNDDLRNLEDPPEEEEEEELVDPHETMREECRASGPAPQLRAKFEQCEERVSSRSKTEETCVEELLDYLHAVDHCAGEKVFSALK
ncbi:cytochrome b-c1 complex subunit 6, mitochondrial-like [Amphibalanus amphitrite]|uniref:cytochrome b-c1 complex subunit 6, mitochondrial-like n=1 Tax=Amphibalanus amphitrite TaxID=1232801 RepID=UPI001C90F819|nr:cytochrome b-c1 complex subunit 6, mitochondrial-like [Amphibalanus amphitrite]